MPINKPPEGTQRCTSIDPANGKRGRPCSSCKLMSQKNNITSKLSKRNFRTPHGTCKTKNVIYCANCTICDLKYVGQTTQELRGRIGAHRYHVGRPPQVDKLERDDSALAEHMKNMHGKPSINDFNNYYKFTIIEIEPKSLNKSEKFWVSRLCPHSD